LLTKDYFDTDYPYHTSKTDKGNRASIYQLHTAQEFGTGSFNKGCRPYKGEGVYREKVHIQFETLSAGKQLTSTTAAIKYDVRQLSDLSVTV